MVYHLGLEPRRWDRKGTGTLVLSARRDVQYLPPEFGRYLRTWEQTKTHLRQNKAAILERFNAQYNTTYTRLIID